jgi:2-polyprenyl-3-methyl-5-hydroxy-6-metoxy-1,4-benzoquinol methylase
MHLLRFVSYEEVRLEKGNFSKKINTAMQLLRHGKFLSFFENTKNNLVINNRNIAHVHDFEKIAEHLYSSTPIAIKTVVDYGCGPGFISFALSKKIKEKSGLAPVTYLVDIDTLVLDFTKFRFTKYNLPIEVIKIDNNDRYPELPKHEICIATEVLEHVLEPAKVAQNICVSLASEGLLYGSMDDHGAHTFHISPNLEKVRKTLEENGLVQDKSMLYKKIGTTSTITR